MLSWTYFLGNFMVWERESLIPFWNWTINLNPIMKTVGLYTSDGSQAVQQHVVSQQFKCCLHAKV